MTFALSLAFVMKWEGGAKITRDPKDPGGVTKYGISQKAYPSLDIESLTEEAAAEIYERDYWKKGRCDSLPHPVSLVHMDACVNCGVVQASKFLQRAAGVDDDGEIGVKTLAAVALADPAQLAKDCVIEREKYYRKLISARPSLLRFSRGWFNRTADLRRCIK